MRNLTSLERAYARIGKGRRKSAGRKGRAWRIAARLLQKLVLKPLTLLLERGIFTYAAEKSAA
jgi:hypothetical protein